MFRNALVVIVALFVTSFACAFGQTTTIQNVWQAPEGSPACHSVFMYLPGLDIDMYNINQAKPTLELVPHVGSARGSNWKITFGAVGAVGDGKLQWSGVLVNASSKVGNNINVALPTYLLKDNGGNEYALCPCIRIFTPLSSTSAAGIGGKFNFGSGNRVLKLGPLYQQKLGKDMEVRFRYVVPVSGGGNPEIRGDLFLMSLKF